MRITVPRWLIVSLAAVFSGYHLVLGAVSLGQVADPVPVVACMLAYAVVTAVVLWPSRQPVLPVWAAAFALVHAYLHGNPFARHEGGAEPEDTLAQQERRDHRRDRQDQDAPVL